MSIPYCSEISVNFHTKKKPGGDIVVGDSKRKLLIGKKDF